MPKKKKIEAPLKAEQEFSIDIPVNVVMREERYDDGAILLNVWLDGDLYDGIAAPRGSEQKILALMKEYGQYWGSYVPKDWR